MQDFFHDSTVELRRILGKRIDLNNEEKFNKKVFEKIGANAKVLNPKSIDDLDFAALLKVLLKNWKEVFGDREKYYKYMCYCDELIIFRNRYCHQEIDPKEVETHYRFLDTLKRFFIHLRDADDFIKNIDHEMKELAPQLPRHSNAREVLPENKLKQFCYDAETPKASQVVEDLLQSLASSAGIVDGNNDNLAILKCLERLTGIDLSPHDNGDYNVLIVECLESLASEGEVEAQWHLANVYLSMDDPFKAEHWYLTAANNGNTPAMYELFLLYEFNENIGVNKIKASHWLKSAAQKGYSGAQLILGLRSWETFPQESFYWLQEAEYSNYKDADYFLGKAYEFGVGTSVDLESALKYYLKAAEHGNADARYTADAQYAIGCIFEEGKGVKKNTEQAVTWFQKAAENGLTQAQLHVGYCCYKGRGVAVNIDAAINWFRLAAEKNDITAMNNLGFALIEKDINQREGFAFLEKAFEFGSLSARYNLFAFFSSPEPCDYDENVEWFVMAEEHLSLYYDTFAQVFDNPVDEVDSGDDDPDFLFAEGLKFEKGKDGYFIDFKEAAICYFDAYTHGNVKAMLRLGHLYKKGRGLNKDLSKALYLYQKAFDMGDSSAEKEIERIKTKNPDALMISIDDIRTSLQKDYSDLVTDKLVL